MCRLSANEEASLHPTAVRSYQEHGVTPHLPYYSYMPGALRSYRHLPGTGLAAALLQQIERFYSPVSPDKSQLIHSPP